MKYFDLQQALQNPDQVTELSLSDRGYALVPPEVFGFSKLKKLDLSGNGLALLPPEIALLPLLESLDISNNALTILPAEAKNLRELKVLNAGENRLRHIPEWIHCLPALRQLHWNNNGLEALPPALFQLTLLEQLDLSNNGLALLPKAVGKLIKLRRLLLAGNRLEALPTEIGHLYGLSELDISHNQLLRLPASLGQLPHLAHLRAAGNQLSALPAALSKIFGLRQIDISNNQFEKLPVAAFGSPWLAHINVSHNRLQRIPAALGKVSQLKKLQLSHNQIRALPPCLSALPKLSELAMNHNQIQLFKWPAKGFLKLERFEIEGNPGTPSLSAMLSLPALRSVLGWGNRAADWLAWFHGFQTPLHLRWPVYRWVEEQQQREMERLGEKNREAILNITIPAFAALFRQHLYQKHHLPLAPGMAISLLGSIFSDFDDLRRRLEKQGISFTKNIEAGSTHLLLGVPPITLPVLKKKKQGFISEREILHWLDIKEGRHLSLAATEDQVLSALQALLLNEHIPNRQIAAQMIQSGGAPLSLLSVAFEYRMSCFAWEEADPLDPLFGAYLSDPDKLYWLYLNYSQKENHPDLPIQPIPANALVDWYKIMQNLNKTD